MTFAHLKKGYCSLPSAILYAVPDGRSMVINSYKGMINISQRKVLLRVASAYSTVLAQTLQDIISTGNIFSGKIDIMWKDVVTAAKLTMQNIKYSNVQYGSVTETRLRAY